MRICLGYMYMQYRHLYIVIHVAGLMLFLLWPNVCIVHVATEHRPCERYLVFVKNAK